MKKSNCRYCGSQIVFLKTDKGHLMPCDLTNVTDYELSFDNSRHKSHFATCQKYKKTTKKSRKQDLQRGSYAV